MNPPRRRSPLAYSETIHSRMEEVESLCLRIRGLLEANDLGRFWFPVELLARECLNNAVLHGNEKDASKSVELALWAGKRWIKLQVSDQGPGFNWRKRLRKGLDTAASSGRGLQLYNCYAERVQFNRRGNQIMLWIDMTANREEGDEPMADYEIQQTATQNSVTLKGDLTAVMVPALQAELKNVLSNRAPELVFDLANTAMLDSSGIGLLIASANTAAANGGKVRVVNVSPDINRLLRSMRLTERLNVSGKTV